jgi:hypothetical protein
MRGVATQSEIAKCSLFILRDRGSLRSVGLMQRGLTWARSKRREEKKKKQSTSSNSRHMDFESSVIIFLPLRQETWDGRQLEAIISRLLEATSRLHEAIGLLLKQSGIGYGLLYYPLPIWNIQRARGK